VVGVAAPARAQAPNANWNLTGADAQQVKVDCVGTSYFGLANSGNGCQAYASDIYENWDASSGGAGDADLWYTRAGGDAIFFYFEIETRLTWDYDGSGESRVYQLELDIDAAGEANRGDYLLTYAPLRVHQGSTWRVVDEGGDGKVVGYRDANNDVGGPSPLTSSYPCGSCNGYDTDFKTTNAVYARIITRGGKRLIQLAVRASAVGSPASALGRIWVGQTSTIPKDKFAWHDAYATSDLSGNRIDNSGGAATADWARAVPQRDLSVSKSDAPDPVAFSDTIAYGLTVTNVTAGSGQATAVSVVDSLPPNVTLVSAIPSQGSCAGTTVITCALGSVANGASATVSIRVRPFVTGTLTNRVRVTAGEADPDTTNNRATVTTTVEPARVRDEFTAISYAGNNGTLDWTGPWVEAGETTSPTGGNIRVVASSYCQSANCLRIGGDEVSINGQSVSREANLLGATSASLTFSYRRRDLDGSGGSVALQVSGDGGASWATLLTIPFSGTDPAQTSVGCGIAPYIGANTRVRFLGSGSVESELYVDNVQIEFSDAAPGATGCGGTAPSVSVTPDGGQGLQQLPSNGGSYSFTFTATNTGTASSSFGLRALRRPGTALTIVSVNGVAGDTADVTIAAGAAQSIAVVYTLGVVASGTADSLLLRATAASLPAARDSGLADLVVVRPVLTVTKGVTPSGTQVPGTDLTYGVTVTNVGTREAVNAVAVDSLPAEVQFKVGTATDSLPPGVSVTVQYSSNAGASWTYTPVSLGCGAPAGYDACVNRIRWTLLDTLSASAPENVAVFGFAARIK